MFLFFSHNELKCGYYQKKPFITQTDLRNIVQNWKINSLTHDTGLNIKITEFYVRWEEYFNKSQKETLEDWIR